MNKIKKIILTLFVGALIGITTFGAWRYYCNETSIPTACAFCNQDILQSHMFYEDNLVMGLCTYKPLVPHHCLIVIKRHVNRIEDVTTQEIVAAHALLKKINTVVQKLNGPSAYLLLQKNGACAGQTVPHVHIHYIPNKEIPNRQLATLGLIGRFIIELFQSTISRDELKKQVDEMKKEFSAKTQTYSEDTYHEPYYIC